MGMTKFVVLRYDGRWPMAAKQSRILLVETHVSKRT